MATRTEPALHIHTALAKYAHSNPRAGSRASDAHVPCGAEVFVCFATSHKLLDFPATAGVSCHLDGLVATASSVRSIAHSAKRRITPNDPWAPSRLFLSLRAAARKYSAVGFGRAAVSRVRCWRQSPTFRQTFQARRLRNGPGLCSTQTPPRRSQ